MPEISILSGIVASTTGDFDESFPRNLVPVPLKTDISLGFLKLADGLKQFGLLDKTDILGQDRGAINWRGNCYRVIGQYFIRVESDGSVTVLNSTMPLGSWVRFDYSFDLLGIACAERLFYWDGAVLNENTNVNLKAVVDMVFVDGYMMTTDGEFIVVPNLNDPYTIDPLKYGGIDADPSPIEGLLKPSDEVYALSRYVITPLRNVGGSGFPFQEVKEAVIRKGSIGTRTSCVFLETIAFLGSGRTEQPNIYIVSGGQPVAITTRSIQKVLRNYPETVLATCLMETRTHDTHQHLYLHLPDQTLVYDAYATQLAGKPVWFYLSSAANTYGVYRPRNFVWCYDQWLCGDIIDSRLIGALVDTTAAQYDQEVGYQFDTPIIYTAGKGAQIHSLELVVNTGNPTFSATDFIEQTIYRQYSKDGKVFSNPKQRSLGKAGETKKRVKWHSCGAIENWRMERFIGRTKAPLSFARLEGEYEALNG